MGPRVDWGAVMERPTGGRWKESPEKGVLGLSWRAPWVGGFLKDSWLWGALVLGRDFGRVLAVVLWVLWVLGMVLDVVLGAVLDGSWMGPRRRGPGGALVGSVGVLQLWAGLSGAGCAFLDGFGAGTELRRATSG